MIISHTQKTDTAAGAWGGVKWGFGVGRHKLSYIGWTENKVLLSIGVSQVVMVAENPPARTGGARDEGSTPGLGRSPGGGKGNPLQYPRLENPVDRGSWWATVHGVAKRDD